VTIEAERIERFIRESHAVERRLRELRHRRFASPHIRPLIDEAIRLSAVLRDQVSAYRALPAPLATDDERLLYAVNAIMLLRDGLLTGLAEPPLVERPSTLMAELERFLSLAVGQPVTVLATPIDELNYAVIDVWRGMNLYLALLGVPDPVAAQNRRFVRVLYPCAEPDNVSLGAILAHEGGHIVLTEHRWDATLVAEMMGDTAVQALAGRIEPQAAFRALPPALQDPILQLLLARSGAGYGDSGILMNWARELLADAIALVTLGPAAALASADVLNAYNVSGPQPWGRSHPRITLRIELQEHYLGGYFDDVLDAYTETVRYRGETNARMSDVTIDPIAKAEELRTAHGRFRLDRNADFYLALETTLRNKFARIIQLVRDTLRPLGLAYDPGTFAQEVPGLVDTLSRGRRPSSNASFAGLVNATVIVQHDRIGDLLQAQAELQALEARALGAGRFEGERAVAELVHTVLRDRHGLKSEPIYLRIIRYALGVR